MGEKVLAKHQQAITEMPVRPDGQNVSPIKDVLSWLDVVPLAGVARVLDIAFFPKWHAAMREWLRDPDCDYGQVVQWYQLWRTMFPDAVRDQGPVQKHLAQGLKIMKHFMGGGSEAEAPAVPKSYADTVEAPQPPSSASTRSQAAEDVTLSLSDYLSEVAAENGLVFRPKKTQRQGKQVYQFGSPSIYLDRNLVYAAPKAGEGDWRIVSMDEVLTLARAETKPRS